MGTCTGCSVTLLDKFGRMYYNFNIYNDIIVKKERRIP